MMALIGRLRRSLCVRDLPLTEFWMAIGLVGLDVVARLLPHAPNFTPVAASALFAGAVLRSRVLALAVPIAASLDACNTVIANHPAATITVRQLSSATMFTTRPLGNSVTSCSRRRRRR